MKTRLITFALAGALILAACGGAATAQPAYSSGYAPAATAAPAATEAPAAIDAPASGGGGAPAQIQHLIIKNATLNLVVNKPLEAVGAITHLTEGAGGYVVSSETFEASYSGQKSQEAKMELRVPADKLTPVLEQIRGMAVEIQSDSVSGQDVTADYVDLQSRLGNLEAKEKQLQTILEQTTNSDDVLKVFDKLSETRQEIERIKGQMKYYEQSAAFSSITLDLIPNVIAQPVEIGGWHPEGVAKDSIETLARIWQALIDFSIRFTIVCGPFLLIAGVPGALALRWLRRQAAKAAQAAKTAQAAQDKEKAGAS